MPMLPKTTIRPSDCKATARPVLGTPNDTPKRLNVVSRVPGGNGAPEAQNWRHTAKHAARRKRRKADFIASVGFDWMSDCIWFSAEPGKDPAEEGYASQQPHLTKKLCGGMRSAECGKQLSRGGRSRKSEPRYLGRYEGLEQPISSVAAVPGRGGFPRRSYSAGPRRLRTA